MHRLNILKWMDSIKVGLPDDVDPVASTIMTEVQDIMICLSSQTNNMYDRDAYVNLQVDFQIFLYLFQRILRQSPGTLLQDSESMILCAPNFIKEAYAKQLIAMPLESKDYLKYGTLVLGDNTPGVVKSDRGMKRPLGFNDFFPKFEPPLIPKIHERKPPSILRDRNNMIREWDERQRHPAVQSFQFLFSLYRMHEMPDTVKRLLADRQSEMVVLDRELLDLIQPHRSLYACAGVTAEEVHLQLEPAMELIRTSDISPRHTVQDQRIQGYVEQLCRQQSLKAILVGPFPAYQLGRLQEKIADYHMVKKAFHVHPDLVYATKMKYTGSAFQNGGNNLQMGDTVACAGALVRWRSRRAGVGGRLELADVGL